MAGFPIEAVVDAHREAGRVGGTPTWHLATRSMAALEAFRDALESATGERAPRPATKHQLAHWIVGATSDTGWPLDQGGRLLREVCPGCSAPPADPIPFEAYLGLDGWAGTTWTKVRVVGATAKRYRIEALTLTRLPGRSRWLEPGERGLVPKHALRREPPARWHEFR